MSTDKPDDPLAWMQGLQKTQAEWMRQWMPWSASLLPAAAQAGNAPGVSGAAGAPRDLTQGILAQMEQSLGVSRSMWDLLGRAAALADTGQRMAAFNSGVQQLQSEFGKLFSPLAAFAPQGGAVPGAAAFTMPGFTGLPPNPMSFGLPWAGMPGVGPAREQQESMDRLGALAGRVMQAQAQLGTQWGQVVNNALRDLGQKLAPQLQGGSLPKSLREVYDLWVETAEKVYAGSAQGNAFTQAQSELANALSQLRIAQRDWLEEWGRSFDLPTRAELNSLHQQVKQLKEAVQKLTGKV